MCPSQDMDDWFQEFKGKYNSRAQGVFKPKTYKRGLLLKNHNFDGEFEIKSAALTNDDISAMINDAKNDYPEKQPFYLCATSEKYLRLGCKSVLFHSSKMQSSTRKCIIYFAKKAEKCSDIVQNF